MSVSLSYLQVSQIYYVQNLTFDISLTIFSFIFLFGISFSHFLKVINWKLSPLLSSFLVSDPSTLILSPKYRSAMYVSFHIHCHQHSEGHHHFSPGLLKEPPYQSSDFYYYPSQSYFPLKDTVIFHSLETFLLVSLHLTEYAKS